VLDGRDGVRGSPMLRAWMRREQWFIWLAVVVVLALIVVAITYHVGWWPELPVWAVLWRWMRATG
jgi:hypothetical protein